MTRELEVQSKQVLTRAREILERDGWCKLSLNNADGQRCASGAIQLAIVELDLPRRLDGPWYECATELLLKEVVRAEGRYYSLIPWWNDEPETTYEDVILMFKRAAADA